jgi:hypothetical protein
LVGGVVATTLAGTTAPTFDSSWNGSCSLAFSGTQGLATSDGALSYAQPDTVFIIYDATSLNSGSQNIFFDGTDSTNREVFYLASGDFQFYSGGGQTGGSMSLNTAYMVETGWNDPTLSYYRANAGASVSMSGTGTAGLTGLTIGCRYNAASGDCNIGHTALITMNTTYNSSTARTNIQGISNSQWGIP